MMPKNTDLLMVGTTEASWKHYKSMIKGGLQGLDMAWGFISNFAPTFADAHRIIPGRPELEVVMISNDLALAQDELLRGSIELAKAIHAHPRHPWVTFGDERLWFLEETFERAGVLVDRGMVEWVIHERWASQVRSAA